MDSPVKSKKTFYVRKISQILFETPSSNFKINRLAEQLGVAKKTLYNHFESKNQLIEDVLDHHLRSKLTAIRLQLSNSSSPISSLLMIGNEVVKTYSDIKFLVESNGLSSRQDQFTQVYLKHLDNLVEITQFIFTKGVENHVFDGDLNTLLASQMYLSGLSVIVRPNCLLKPKLSTPEQQQSVAYYLLKGYCTPIGLVILREQVDLKISSSEINLPLSVTLA